MSTVPRKAADGAENPGVQPPPPLPGRAIGPIRGRARTDQPRRAPFPATLPTCCAEHRLPALKSLDFLFAADAFRLLEQHKSMGWPVDSFDEVVEGLRRYLTARMNDAIDFGADLWRVTR